jgi:hypothetical protein
MDPSMSLWSTLDGFTAWYFISEICCNVVYISYSPSQMYCATQVSASTFTKPHMQLCHLLSQECHETVCFMYHIYVVGSESFQPDQLFKVTEIKQLCYFST